MKDKDKIKEQWQNKLMKSRQQITRLENLKTNHGEKENKLAKFEKMYFLITTLNGDYRLIREKICYTITLFDAQVFQAMSHITG